MRLFYSVYISRWQAVSFHRVNRSLCADTGARSLTVLLIGFLLVSAWLAWAFKARVTRYALADSARIEADGSAYPIQSNADGVVVSSSLVLGRTVRTGDVLAELDSEPQRLSLAEAKSHAANLAPQIAALQAQLDTEGQGASDERHVLAVSIEEARAQYREADTQAALAADQADRAGRLHADGIVSDLELQRARADAQSKRAAADSLKAAAARLAPELKVHERDRQVRQRQIQADIAKLQAEAAASAAAVRRLEYEIGQRQIRAAVSGRLGECVTLHPGSYLTAGQQLGVIIPEGNLQVVAEFAPAAAVGKVRTGQSAIVRLQGFPWAQYGIARARVARVADDIRNGKVRVELVLDHAQHLRIPLQHGLPASVEVQIESVSPAAMLLRSAGQVLGSH